MKLTTILLFLAAAHIHAQPVYLPTYFQESFNGPGLPAGWTVTQIAGPLATWNIVGTGTNPPIQPYLAPGQAKFNSYDAGPGEQARLTSPAVNLSSAIDPFVEFQIYHDDEFLSTLDSLYVEVSTSDSVVGPWTILEGILRPAETPGWTKVAASLLPYTGNSRVYIGLRGVSQYGNNMFLDEVRIADSSFHDIGIVTIVETNPQKPSPVPEDQRGREPRSLNETPLVLSISATALTALSVVVNNLGTFDETAYQVAWELDTKGQNPVSNVGPLVRNTFDTLSLPLPQLPSGVHTITAWTELTGDLNHANDTIRTTIIVADTSILFFEGFNSTSFPPAGWSTINRDGGILGPWFRGSASSVFVPFEGAGFAANNFLGGNSRYIDDYLITPQITGVVQASTEDSLIFWTRSAFNPPPFANYPDSLMILISTTGNDTASFTTILDYFDVPKTGWVRKAFRLTGSVAQNADIYIAFRYLHYNGGETGSSSDFIGVDAVQIKQQPPLDVADQEELLTGFRLEQNYPNPFNPITTIRFSVGTYGPASPAGRPTTLQVYDVLGRRVRTLVNDNLQTGNHERTFDASGLASGIYFYRLQSRNFVQIKKMILLY